MYQTNSRQKRILVNGYCLLVGLIGLTGTASAVPIPSELAVQVGRYSTRVPLPTREQTDPLSAMTVVHFAKTISTVGEAIDRVLQQSGYRLVDVDKLAEEDAVVLSLPLPHVHREMGPMPVRRIVQTLLGRRFVLIKDPVHRLIAFEQCVSAGLGGNH